MPLSDYVDLFIPRTCAGCGCETVTLCTNCLRGLDTETVSMVPRFGTLTVYGAGPYEGVLRNVLVNFKEHDRRDVTSVLGLLLARAVVAALSAVEVSGRPILLVPIPARRASQLKRGGNHVEVLARTAAGQLSRDGVRVGVAPVLAVRSRTDQVGSGTRARRSNVHNTHSVAHPRTVAMWPGRATVVLVDDIVTTGATVAESTRALKALGVQVHAVASVGITGVRY